MIDVQSGHEKTITGMLAALAGVNVIYGLGMLETGLSFDLAQLVIDNEFAGMIKHGLKGIVVNEETLSVDIIKEMGIGRDYVGHDSTFAHMRDISQSDLIDRRMRETWAADGETDMVARARMRVKEILENHRPVPLADEVKARLSSIVAQAEHEMGLTG